MKLRHELKHYINISDYLVIKSRLKAVAKLDPHGDEQGEYSIRSLYFDDYNDRVLSEKIIGLNNRDKFRIRIYNSDDSFIKLEKKTKINGLCKKDSCLISKAECESIQRGETAFLRDRKNHLLNEFYVRMNSERLKPKVIVDYIREAYVYGAGNVRITFDKSVKTGLSNIDIFDKNLSTVETLCHDYIILEVKYDEFLPELIANLIQVGDRNKTAISKYAMCRIYG